MIQQRLEFPLISRPVAAASRSRHAPRTVLTFADDRYRLSVAEKTDALGNTAEAGVIVDWGGHVLIVRCAMGLVGRIVSTLDPALELGDVPPDLFGLLLEAAMLSTLTGAERRSGRHIRIETVGSDPEISQSGRLSLNVDDGERHWPVEVSGRDDALADILQAWPIEPRSLSRFPLPAALRIGTTRLPMASLRSLKPDDTVLLQTRRQDSATLIVAEAWQATSHHQDGQWHLEEALRPARSREEKEWIMRRDDDPVEGDPAGGLDDIPVQVAFDVGRVELALGELRRLGIGSVVELNRNVDDLVRISANGRFIGHGVLVDVEGRVGVQIVRLFDHG